MRHRTDPPFGIRFATPFLRSPAAGAKRLALVLVAAASAAGTASAQAPAAVESFGAWTLYADLPAKSVCFIAATAADSTPKPASGEASVLYISAWPREGVKSELSAKVTGRLKKGSDASVTVGTASFRLFGKDDRAFVDDPTRELKLIDAMKKGTKAVVRSELERGGAVTDTYALDGFAQALQALAKICP